MHHAAPVEGAGIGICCSGGGIRSAAFNLGALQSLDEKGLLRAADYLSAVSGGSFIAAAWAIAARHSDPDLLRDQRAFAPGSPEERWVRTHSSYLVDGVGDTVRLAGVALVGFLANVVLFTALLWTVARPLGWLYGAWQPDLRVPDACGPSQTATEAAATGCFASPTLDGLGPWAVAAAVLAGLALVIGLGVRMFTPRWSRRLRLSRAALALLVAGVAVAVVTLVIPGAIVALRDLLGGEPAPAPGPGAAASASAPEKSASNLSLVTVVGAATTVVALVTQVRSALHREEVTRAASWITRQSRGLRRVFNSVLGALIAPAALAAGALMIVDTGATAASPSRAELGWWALAAALSALMLAFGDVTGWSLHPYYKRRLARTFAVERVRDPATGRPAAAEVPFEEVLSLSGFDPASFSRSGRGRFPELLVCGSVNVSDRGATPPGRNAYSFVFSPSQVGCPDHARLQFPTSTYEELIGERRRRDVTLPAAVAISGAAVAPAMGKMTRPSLRFLLALTNVRLGVWLPNPGMFHPEPFRVTRPPRVCESGDAGDRPRLVRRLTGVRPRQWHLLFEVVGRYRERSRYLYVTDGGHVENLGLLELLRRKCRVIVCLDAAGDSVTSFSTLGEALALAEADLGVTVDIEPAQLRPAPRRVNAGDHVVGTIRYADGAPGTLVYGKALVTAGAPWSVRAFGEKDRHFPTHPTGDQAYGGDMFEAYQQLGRHVGARCADAARDRAKLRQERLL